MRLGALLFAFLIPALAVANVPLVRIILPETVAVPALDALRLEPEVELVNAGETPLAYRVYGDAGHPIWADRIDFQLIDASGNTAAPIYFHLSDIFSSRKVVLGIGVSVRLRYRQPVKARIGPGRYTLRGTAVVQDERGEWHKVQCTPATFTVTTESGNR
jgi:hypothetical protein